MEVTKAAKTCKFYYAVFLFFSLVFFLFLIFSLKSTIVSAQTSTDAIAIRVYSNPDHYSALRWYRAMGFGGSPQSLIVDGYEAVRDGQTVYVNAGNVDLEAVPEVLHTNIYVITYTLGAESATKDIFAQILARWTFNTNLAAGETWGGNPAVCGEDASVRCLTDRDCAKKGFCDSAKAQVTRDTIRLSRLYDIDFLIRVYSQKHGHYPTLAAGTYLPQISLSVWPSWQNTLAKDLGSTLPVDPINKLIDCAERFNPVTCWDERAKEFAWTENINDATLPEDNFVFLYKYGTPANPQRYTLCAFSETGMFEDPNKMCNSHCVPACYLKQCGPDGCGDLCGECPDGEYCPNGRCVFDCNTAPRCLASLAHGEIVAGYCPEGRRCFDCKIGYNWNGSVCACLETCGAAGQPGCQSSAPANAARAYGTCCTPGELCYECPYGTTWNGLICEIICSVTCNTPNQPNCRATAPANSEQTGGECCLSGYRCYRCQSGYVWDNSSGSCVCPPVAINPVPNTPIYANPVGDRAYLSPRLFLFLATISDSQTVNYSMTGNPGWLIIGPSTGQMQGSQTSNSANSYNITVRAQNLCGLGDNTNFTLTVLPNEWCGDGILQDGILQTEQCEFSLLPPPLERGTGVNNQWSCNNDCEWSGGWCGNGLCEMRYEYYDSCPDCELIIGTDFEFCTDEVAQPDCYTGPFPTPTLVWHVTPQSAQAEFMIQIDFSTGAGYSFDPPVLEFSGIGNNNTFTVNSPGLLFNETYNWRLKIRDTFGTWSGWAQCDGPFATSPHCP